MSSLPRQTWLVCRNDLRLLFRDFRSSKLKVFAHTGVVVLVLLLAHAVTGALFYALHRDPPAPVVTGVWLFFGFLMLGAAMNVAISQFFERADFDLLLASPIPARAVLLARLLTMAAGSFLSAAWFLCPLIDGIGAFHSPYYFFGYIVWLCLAVMTASAGLVFTLSLVRWLGPRRARTWVQVVAAVLGATVYLTFQLRNVLPPADLERYAGFILTVLDSPLSMLAYASRGAPLALLTLLALSAVGALAASRLLARTFLRGMQESEMRAAPARRTACKTFRFAESLRWAAFRKELRLISRDPLLLSQILPTTMYIVPALIGLRKFGGITVLAPICVVVATQFSSLLADVAVAGEEGLDLIRMSPSPEIRLRVSKLLAGMSLPLALTGLLCSILLFGGRPWLALLTFAISGVTGAGAGWLSVTRVQPTPRKDVLRPRRRGIGTLRTIVLTLLLLNSCAGIAMVAQGDWWLVGLVLLAVSCLIVLGCFTLVSIDEIDYEAVSS